jgi:hypothetical protein
MHSKPIRTISAGHLAPLNTFVTKSLNKRKVIAIYKEQRNEDRE